MKVYLTIPQPSRGLQRIADALTRYAPPSVEVVESIADADLVVLYAIGRCEQLTAQAEWLTSLGKKYAVIQVCLRSTQKPHVFDWYDLWDEATVVWSYYDLVRLCREDGSTYWVHNSPRLYHAPLGADAEVFKYDPNVRKIFTIATSGSSYLSESVRECWLATIPIEDSAVFHVGPRLQRSKSSRAVVVYSDDCDDICLSASYQQCAYVSALRRKEGFELPGIEGLLCGARPICFRGHDWEWNYGSFAEYIEETDRQGVIDQLVELFRGPYRVVAEQEITAARERFNWETICKGFYDKIL